MILSGKCLQKLEIYHEKCSKFKDFSHFSLIKIIACILFQQDIPMSIKNLKY